MCGKEKPPHRIGADVVAEYQGVKDMPASFPFTTPSPGSVSKDSGDSYPPVEFGVVLL